MNFCCDTVFIWFDEANVGRILLSLDTYFSFVVELPSDVPQKFLVCSRVQVNKRSQRQVVKSSHFLGPVQ